MSIEKHTHTHACSGILKPPRQSPWGQGREWKYWSTEIYSACRQLAGGLLLTNLSPTPKNEIYIIWMNQKYQPHIGALSAPRYTNHVNTIYSYHWDN